MHHFTVGFWKYAKLHVENSGQRLKNFIGFYSKVLHNWLVLTDKMISSSNMQQIHYFQLAYKS